jgi:hypothetical protein
MLAAMTFAPPPDVDVTLTASPTPGEAVDAFPAPQLIVLLQGDAPTLPATRHLLTGTARVRFGRGAARQHARRQEDGARTLGLTFPDALSSTRHAVLSREGRDGPFILEDAGSKNGTWVNGRRIDRKTLVDGDVLEFGQTFCLFRDAAPVDVRTPPDTPNASALAAAKAWATFHDPLAAQYRRLVRVAHTTVPVLVLGETGTGKEVVARTLHQLSGRTPEMMAVNCAAIPASLIEAELFGHKKGAFTGSGTERLGWIRSADRSTLFLDEIGELPPALQATFLRALETSEVVPVGADRPVKVDFRLVSATHRDLDADVERGTFRADLRARLGAMTITLPPLRDRREDLGLLLPAILARIAGAGTPAGSAAARGHSCASDPHLAAQRPRTRPGADAGRCSDRPWRLHRPRAPAPHPRPGGFGRRADPHREPVGRTAARCASADGRPTGRGHAPSAADRASGQRGPGRALRGPPPGVALPRAAQVRARPRGLPRVSDRRRFMARRP